MRRVEQRQYENGDCGVACVAMITGKSYEEVESAFHENGLVIDGQYFTLHKDLIIILKSFGYEAVRRRFSSWDAVEFPAIVKINVRSGNYWHWVVMAGARRVFDPKPGAPDLVSDYRGRKGEGQYLHVIGQP